MKVTYRKSENENGVTYAKTITRSNHHIQIVDVWGSLMMIPLIDIVSIEVV